MELNEYQTLAQRTSNTNLLSDKIKCGILGLCGESGECADIYKKYMFQGHEFDREAMVSELGDVLWYVAELAAGLGITLEDVKGMKTQVYTLKKRLMYELHGIEIRGV